MYNQRDLDVKWQLIENNYQNLGKTQSSFTFTNNGKVNFPSKGWVIYFTSSREIDSAAATGAVIISHVNGDQYKITPTSDFKDIKPKDSVRIKYFSNDVLINYTAAPCGLYIVWDTNLEKGIVLDNFRISPLINTTTGLVTPEKIFNQNKLIRDIPEKELPKIFPTPLFYKETADTFILDANTTIKANDEFKKEAKYLAGELNVLFHKNELNIPDNYREAKIILEKSEMNKEAYKLSVSGQQIIISASTGAGIFYGIQSLRSMILSTSNNSKKNIIKIPAVQVQDEPRFGYRALMMDVARNFIPKSEVLKILDLMAMYKMNILHFHFSDDEGWRIEIPSLPELTSIGSVRGHTLDSKKMLPVSYASGPDAGKLPGSGYFTRNDFIEILKYANERHIEVLPEIETPGHSRAAIKAMDARYEKFIKQGNKEEAEKYLLHDVNDKSVYSSAQKWNDNVMCVALPSVYTFIEKIADEFLSMYQEAGAPLTTIHMGGDEVPEAVWEKSPICQQLISTDSSVKNTDDLWYYYFKKVNAILKSKGLYLSGWEEVGMRKTILDGKKKMIVNPRFANDNMQIHVWNNMVGWGNEDLPYRLANAGYKVVLSPVSNNYFDLAYYKSPDEPGYYWGGFQDIDKPFYFIPFDYYKNTKEDAAGNSVDLSYFVGKDRLTDFGKSNIVGIEGLIWSENLRNNDQFEYLLFPKLLGLAERAWAKSPEWAEANDLKSYHQLYDSAWSVFVNVIGKRELRRLNYMAGAVKYRIPTPGAISINGKVFANIQFPGLTIRYSTNGKEPVQKSPVYHEAITQKGEIKLRAFDYNGRPGRTITINNL
ncbi:MAG: carbohydate-binding domain-containing protein [Bacteroidetes bacterium]|nr:carbohydate-binding domain-containing protein [Bacteroidota bacterium]